MKRTLLLLLFALFATSQINAQTQMFANGVGISIVKNEYSGDYGNAFGDFDQSFNLAGSLSYNRYFTRSFDLCFLNSFGQVSYYKNSSENFDGLMLNSNLLFKYKLANDIVMPASSVFAPVLYSGFGIAMFFGDNIETDGFDVVFSIGPGARFKFNDLLFIELSSITNFSNKDHRDGKVWGKRDVFYRHSVGLIFNIRKRYYRSYL